MLASRCRGTTAALPRRTRAALRTGAALCTGVLEPARSSRVAGRGLPLALVGLLIAGASSGCRSGSAAFSAPKWWSLGGGKAESTFASAPTPGKDASGDPVKPSSTATPYPTTSTPGAYNLAGPGATPAAAAAAPASAVTYGTTPPPAVAPAAVASTPPAAAPAQVGPYSMLPGAPPAPAPSSALVPAPAVAAGQPGAFPETAGYEPASRFAAAPAAGAPAAPVAGSRYAAGPAAATEGAPGRYAELPAAAVASGSAAEGPAASRYAAASGSRFGPPTDALAPPPSFSPPPPVAPVASPMSAPVAPAVPGTSSPAGPTDPSRSIRRPDPGYRPAGTSSYRPSGALLADGPPAPQPGAAADVQSAAFETEALPPRDE